MWSSVLIEYIKNELNGIPYMFKESPFYEINSPLRKAGLQFKMTETEKDIQNSQKDIQVFSEFLMLFSKKLILRDFQSDMLNQFYKNPKYVIFGSRQIGLNHTLAICALHYAMFEPGKKVVVFSHNKQLSEHFIKLIESFVCSLKFAYQPGIVSHNKYSFIFENGSEIITKSYNKHTLKTFDPEVYDRIILNDCGYVKNIKAYFDVIEKCEQEKNKSLNVCIASTGYQYVNQFHHIANYAKLNKNSYKYTEINWWQVPGRNEDWKEKTIRSIGSEEFNKTYELIYNLNQKSDPSSLITLSIPVNTISTEELNDIIAKYGKYLK